MKISHAQLSLLPFTPPSTLHDHHHQRGCASPLSQVLEVIINARLVLRVPRCPLLRNLQPLLQPLVQRFHRHLGPARVGWDLCVGAHADIIPALPVPLRFARAHAAARVHALRG